MLIYVKLYVLLFLARTILNLDGNTPDKIKVKLPVPSNEDITFE